MACAPDAALAEMTGLLAEAVHHLHEAIGTFGTDADATKPAEAAIKAERNHERAYRAGMAALLEIDDLREVIVDAWLVQAPKRLAKEYLAANA